jgi:hypothetical protein
MYTPHIYCSRALRQTAASGHRFVDGLQRKAHAAGLSLAGAADSRVLRTR